MRTRAAVMARQTFEKFTDISSERTVRTSRLCSLEIQWKNPSALATVVDGTILSRKSYILNWTFSNALWLIGDATNRERPQCISGIYNMSLPQCISGTVHYVRYG